MAFRSLLAAILALAALVLSSCADGRPAGPGAAAPPTRSALADGTGPVSRPTPARAQPPRPVFVWSVRRLSAADRRHMTGVSWHQGCPVGLDRLRRLAIRFVTYTGATRIGHLVVNRDVVGDVVRAFRAMYRHGFRIRRMRVVEHYGGSDHRSVKADNTSAFNCRRMPGSGTWSQHAYGRAIDINPVQNPYVVDGVVEPLRGRPYLDRSRRTRGMIHEGGVTVRSFDRLGWGWGGRWTSVKDWQHFSVNGR